MAKHLLKFNTAAEYSAATINKPAVSWVVEDNEVKYDPYVPPYVEIGGVKWAKMNIGAETETDYGLYFQWGDISGYTASQVGTDKTFNWENYKYWTSDTGSGSSGMTKYNSTDNLTTLEASDDAAIANLGSDWRMPTRGEFQSLINATTNAWVTNYNGSGVDGILFTDKEDSSKVLFFPAAGYVDGNKKLNTLSYYWSSTLIKGVENYAIILTVFQWVNVSCSINKERYYGYSIRPVHV